MTKLFKLFVLFAIVFVAIVPSAQAFAQDEKPEFKITGAPKSVDLPTDKKAGDYKSTLGIGIGNWVAEPGVLTGDPGDAACKANASCWWISPDTQIRLTDPEREGFDLREDAWTMITFAGGTVEVGEDVEITVEPSELHTWFVILRGEKPGDGDRNVPIRITGYNPGFGLATNLPAGARMSEDYLKQNVAGVYSGGSCGGGCKSVSVLIFDVRTNAWIVITQSGKDTAWEEVGSNLGLS